MQLGLSAALRTPTGELLLLRLHRPLQATTALLRLLAPQQEDLLPLQSAGRAQPGGRLLALAARLVSAEHTRGGAG